MGTSWATIFTIVAVVLFLGTLAASEYAGWNDELHPCRLIAADAYQKSLPAEQRIAAAASASSPVVLDYQPKTSGLGRPVCLVVGGAANAVGAADDKHRLHLYLDGLELKDSMGRLAEGSKTLVLFDLTRSATDADVWNRLMGQLWRSGNGAGLGGIGMRLGVGTEEAGEFDHVRNSDGADLLKPIVLRIVDPLALAIGIGAFLAAVAALCCAADQSAILRDGGPTSAYSLGRVQMAFWLYLVTAGFIYIWLVTGDYNGVLTSQSLTLLGISGTTGLMAIAAGTARDARAGGAAAPTATPATSPAKPPPGKLAQFLDDILTDDGGVALHRLQIVVWTVILGIIFLAEICRSFRLPSFDSNLLILMGISGVTYVGFKFNEK